LNGEKKKHQRSAFPRRAKRESRIEEGENASVRVWGEGKERRQWSTARKGLKKWKEAGANLQTGKWVMTERGEKSRKKKEYEFPYKRE